MLAQIPDVTHHNFPKILVISSRMNTLFFSHLMSVLFYIPEKPTVPMDLYTLSSLLFSLPVRPATLWFPIFLPSRLGKLSH